MSDDRAELERLRKLKRLRELEAKAAGGEPQAGGTSKEETAPTGIAGFLRGLQEGADPTLRGARQGLTFGQSANIDGLVQALIEKGGGSKGSFADAFDRNKGTTQRGNDAAFDAHPWLYSGGNAAGTLATMMLPFGQATRASQAAEAAGTGAEVAPKLVSLGQLARQGGRSGLVVGGLNGLANGLGDLFRGNYGRLAGDVALGAIPGGILGAGLGPLQGLVSRAVPALENFAARQAVKAAGPLKRDVLALIDSGRLESTGQKLLENGVVPTGAAIDEIANRAATAADSRGADVHSILGELDALRPPGPPPASLSDVATGTLTRLPPALEGREPGGLPGALDLIPYEPTVSQRVTGSATAAASAPMAAAGELAGFNPYRVGAKARAELLNPLRDQPALQDLIPGLESKIQDLEALGNRRITFQRANDVKRGYDKLLDWTKEQTPQLELLKQLRGLINGEIESSADAAASQAGNPELLGRFRSAKADYRDLRNVADFAQRAAAGQEAKNYFGLPEYIAGIGPALGALASGHPLVALGGLGSAFGTKLARERGGSVAANAALGLGRRLSIPGNLAELGARGATSWAARARGQAALSDLLGGGTVPWGARAADAAQEAFP